MRDIHTKINEEITMTDDPEKMLEKYLKDDIKKIWTEDFVDEDTGDVVTIERHETLFQRGTYLDNNVIPQLLFHIAAGDIKEVVLTNQKREARFVKNERSSVWSVSVEMNTKKKIKLLLYSNSIEMALETSKDYIELNYSGLCKIINIKEFGDLIMIENQFQDIDNDGADSDKKYYKIEVKMIYDDSIQYYTFLVLSTDVDASMIVINNWISKSLQQKEKDLKDFTTVIESAVVIPCNHIIEKEFSEAYLEEEK